MKTALKQRHRPRVHFDLTGVPQCGQCAAGESRMQSALKIAAHGEALELWRAKQCARMTEGVQSYRGATHSDPAGLPQGYLYAGTAAAGLGDLAERRKTTKRWYRSLPRMRLVTQNGRCDGAKATGRRRKAFR